jgi:hypothetical protein
MLFSKTVVLLAILPFSIASSCSESNALAWPSSSDSSDGSFDSSTSSSSDSSTDSSSDDSSDGSSSGASGSGCLAFCDANPFTGCADDCANDSCFAKYYTNLDALKTCQDIGETGECNSVGCRRSLKKRATITCTSSETCYLYTDGTLLCLDLDTGMCTSTIYITHRFCIAEIEYETDLLPSRRLH